MVDLALAFCDEVDVFGTGMFSRGPGFDTIYHHYYERLFPSGCRQSACLTDDEAARRPEAGLSSVWLKKHSIKQVP
eukprot:7379168-Prymnesium_polylepis.3